MHVITVAISLLFMLWQGLIYELCAFICYFEDNYGIRGKDIMWQCKGLEFGGVPASFVGRMRLKCRHGPSKADKRCSRRVSYSYYAGTDCFCQLS